MLPSGVIQIDPLTVASDFSLRMNGRVFVDFVVEAFRQRRLAERFASSIG